MKTRTEITFEMDRLIVVNRSRKAEWSSRMDEMRNADDTALVNSLLELLKETRDEDPDD